MKTLLIVLTVSLSSQAFALTRVMCSGKHQGKSVVLHGEARDLTDLKSSRGTVSVDGRDVADFEGGDARINYIFLSLKAKNARGELLEGKITDIAGGAGLVTRLYVPGFGIDFRNVAVTCVERTF